MLRPFGRRADALVSRERNSGRSSDQELQLPLAWDVCAKKTLAVLRLAYLGNEYKIVFSFSSTQMKVAKTAMTETSARSQNTGLDPPRNSHSRTRGSRHHRHRRDRQLKRLAAKLLLYLLVFLVLVAVAHMIPKL